MPEDDGKPKNKRWAVGSHVVLRGGCVCRVASIFSASYREGRSGELRKWYGWNLVCLEHGNKICVGDNGDWSPVSRGHANDVIGRASSTDLAKMKHRMELEQL